MSKTTEYLNLFLKGIPNSKEILSSIVKNVQLKYNTLPENEKEEIIRRRVICASCPFMSKNAISSEEYLSLTGKNYKAYRRADHCSFCGCGVDMRTGSLDSNCGAETWNKEHPENTISLKWTKFNTDETEHENKENTTGFPDRHS